MAFRKKEEKEWYSINEIAKLFGLSRNFIVNQIKNGKLKACHMGDIYRINKEWLDQWVTDSVTA